jgi:hypothetical protein
MMLLPDCFRRLKRAIIETYAKALRHLKVAIILSGGLSGARDKGDLQNNNAVTQ